MVTTRFYLDCRDCAPGSPAPLKIVLTLKGVRALIATNISLLPTQWDSRRQIVIGHARKQQFNSLLAEQKIAIDSILFRLSSAGELRGLRACDIRRLVLAELHPEAAESESKRVTFLARFNSFITRRSSGTQRIYLTTLTRMRAYLNERLDALAFEDITVQWLRDFDKFLTKTSPSRNARNIHFRNIRAVFNDASPAIRSASSKSFLKRRENVRLPSSNYATCSLHRLPLRPSNATSTASNSSSCSAALT